MVKIIIMACQCLLRSLAYRKKNIAADEWEEESASETTTVYPIHFWYTDLIEVRKYKGEKMGMIGRTNHIKN